MASQCSALNLAVAIVMCISLVVVQTHCASLADFAEQEQDDPSAECRGSGGPCSMNDDCCSMLCSFPMGMCSDSQTGVYGMPLRPAPPGPDSGSTTGNSEGKKPKGKKPKEKKPKSKKLKTRKRKGKKNGRQG